jgi:hypothetical protein
MCVCVCVCVLCVCVCVCVCVTCIMWIPGWHIRLEDIWKNTSIRRELQLHTALSADRTDDGRLSGFLPAFGLNSQ